MTEYDVERALSGALPSTIEGLEVFEDPGRLVSLPDAGGILYTSRWGPLRADDFGSALLGLQGTISVACLIFTPPVGRGPAWRAYEQVVDVLRTVQIEGLVYLSQRPERVDFEEGGRFQQTNAIVTYQFMATVTQ